MDNVILPQSFNTGANKRQEIKQTPIYISVIYLLISGYLFVMVFQGVASYNRNRELLDTRDKEVEELRIENIELIMDKENVQSKDYIETEARNRLNYGKKGEIVFVISDLAYQEAQLKISEILSPAVQDARPPLQKWIDMMFM